MPDLMALICMLMLVVSAFAVLQGLLADRPTPPDPLSDFPSRSHDSPFGR